MATAHQIIGRRESHPTRIRGTNMEINRGDYVKLTDANGGDVGVAWEINPKNAASVEVY